MWYTRDGKPLPGIIGVPLTKEDRQVSRTVLPDGKLVSTVFLGLDHSFGDGPPLIFETMVFPPDSLNELDCERYSTEKEAIVGHTKMVEKWTAEMSRKAKGGD